MNTVTFQQRNNSIRKIRGHDSSPLMPKVSFFSPSSSITPMKTRSHLFGISVIKRNAIIVTGISPNTNKENLKNFFGKYGKICRCVLNPSSYYEIRQRDANECVAYIAYISDKGATNAVRNADSTQLDKKCIKVSFTITKYCDKFLKGDYCEDRDCLYLHEVLPEHIRVDTNESGKKIFSSVENLAEEKSCFCREDSSGLITRNLLYVNSYAIKDCSMFIPPEKNFDASVGGCRKFNLSPKESLSSTLTGFDNPFVLQSPFSMTKQNFIFQTKSYACSQRQRQIDLKVKVVDSNFKSHYNLPIQKKSLENFHYSCSKTNFLPHHHHENHNQRLHFHGLEPRFHSSISTHSQFRHPIYRQKMPSSRVRAENTRYYYRNNLFLNSNANIPRWNKDALGASLKMYQIYS